LAFIIGAFEIGRTYRLVLAPNRWHLPRTSVDVVNVNMVSFILSFNFRTAFNSHTPGKESCNYYGHRPIH
jgi:hypothetical protein